MKKEDLRKVEYRFKKETFGVPDRNEMNEGIGYFHLWNKSVLENGDESVYALVELENGKMNSLLPREIKFLS